MQPGRSLSQILALVVLATIAVDLGDASCDPIRTHNNDGARLSAPEPEHDADPCDRFCVPDCFACSSLVVTGPILLIAEMGPSEDRPPAPVERLSPGVSPVPDHPPRGVL
ncbi:MAG TPA: hypothetical protein VFG76_05720 [Candidatus Polarisedimenticolia bacterium]|nr:hypothetical protein [Candidatus Polarisedimenticolia bacterium]